MIRIFRKLRRKLISEQNYMKYMKYAIGEILLVAIGILLALAVNNWNNSRVESRTLSGYLRNVKKNIETDFEALQKIKTFREKSMASSKFFIKLSNDRELSVEGLNIFISEHMAYMPIFDESFTTSKSGFEGLKNSGYLAKLQGQELETALFDYYDLAEKIRIEEVSLNEFMEEMEYDMYKNNIVQEFRLLVGKLRSGKSTKKDEAKILSILQYPAFKGANSRNVNVNYLIDFYDQLSGLGEQILQTIESR